MCVCLRVVGDIECLDFSLNSILGVNIYIHKYSLLVYQCI
jgi:hypothetical protein